MKEIAPVCKGRSQAPGNWLRGYYGLSALTCNRSRQILQQLDQRARHRATAGIRHLKGRYLLPWVLAAAMR